MKIPSELVEMHIGYHIGIYATAQMILEGFPVNDKTMEAVKGMSAKYLEKTTGMPVEDFASVIDPLMAEIAKEIKEIEGINES